MSNRISDERHPLDADYLDESGAALLPQRISSDRLWELKEIAKTSTCNEWKCMVSEIEQSRALVTELRALAERKSSASDWMFAQGYDCALSELTSLLAAHDTQQADKTNG